MLYQRENRATPCSEPSIVPRPSVATEVLIISKVFPVYTVATLHKADPSTANIRVEHTKDLFMSSSSAWAVNCWLLMRRGVFRRSLMAKYKIGELVEADRVATKSAFAPQWTNDTPQEQGKCVIA